MTRRFADYLWAVAPTSFEAPENVLTRVKLGHLSLASEARTEMEGFFPVHQCMCCFHMSSNLSGYTNSKDGNLRSLWFLVLPVGDHPDSQLRTVPPFRDSARHYTSSPFIYLNPMLIVQVLTSTYPVLILTQKRTARRGLTFQGGSQIRSHSFSLPTVVPTFKRFT